MLYMDRALDLARMARGSTSPNPAVGTVIVKDGLVVGEGYTQPAGSAHAEIVALLMAGSAARGATMYVTLEPCSHYGRTPPCVEAIIEAGIREVHVAIGDPNPFVSGRGLQRLEQAGVKIVLGEGAEEATEINEAFVKHVTSGKPYVTAKWAMSLDGKIATRTGDAKWITGVEARAQGHYLRAINDAVVVGIGTVLADDPELTVRIPSDLSAADSPAKVWPVRPNPSTRVVVDSRGRIPLDAKVLDTQAAPTLLATTDRLDTEKKRILQAKGVEVVTLTADQGVVNLAELLQLLGQRGYVGVLIEGGGKILGSAITAGLVDKVCAFIAPKIIGGEEAPSPVRGLGIETIGSASVLERQRCYRLGDDTLIMGYVSKRR